MTDPDGRTRPAENQEQHRRLQELQAKPALTDQERGELAGLFFGVALAYYGQGTPEALQKAFRCYDEVITLYEGLKFGDPQYRIGLADANIFRGVACQDMGTPEDLQEAIYCYNEAIALFQKLDLDVPEYRNGLARAWCNRGLACQAMGTPEDLQEAICCYDTAIALREKLDPDVPKYRNGLALAYSNLGNAYQGMGTYQGLRKAIRCYDKAIALYEERDCDEPKNRNGLLIAHMNRGLACKAMGTPEDLQKAIRSHDRAIGLGKELNLDVLENCNFLAIAYNKRGHAYAYKGDPKAQREAIRSYDKAIALAEKLNLDVPEYRHSLSDSYMNLGNAYQAIGAPDDLQKAIHSYNKAIPLAEKLNLANPKYRTGLANAYINLGNAYQAMGGQKSLREAIHCFTKAIALFQKLDLDVPEYRNGLTSAWYNRGNAEKAIGTPAELQGAICCYKQAIALAEKLDLDVPEYRNVLAMAWNNRGLAYAELDTPEARQEAYVSYRQALTISAPLPRDVAKFVDTRAKALTNKALVCLRLGAEYLDEASDAVDEALDLLRALESRGVYLLRPTREWAFSVAMDVYVVCGPQFIPEVILENLDPDKPGAAPQSAAMHKRALDGLHRANMENQRRSRTQEIVTVFTKEYHDAHRRLAEIRGQYFGVTATAANLAAEYARLSGDLAKAEAIFVSYTETRPSDPEGNLLLGMFHADQGREAALFQYEKAFQGFAATCGGAPDTWEQEPSFHTMRRIAELAVAFIQGEWPEQDAKGSRDAMLVRCDQAKTWLSVLRAQVPGAAALAARHIVQELDTRITAERAQWLELHEASQRKQWNEQKTQEHKAMIQAVIRSLGASLRLLLGAYAEALQASLAQAWETNLAAWLAGDAAERARIEEQVAEFLSREVKRCNEQLEQSEIALAEEQVRELLGPLWDALLDEERRHLAVGLHLFDRHDLRQFSGLSLGLAVETALLRRIFETIRDRRRACGAEKLAVVKADHHLEPPLANYLNAVRDHLMLGQMVGALGSALFVSGTPERPVFAFLQEALAGLADVRFMRGQDDKACALRKKSLDRINVLRRKCAHCERPISQEELIWMWEHVAADPEHAAMRYLVGAFARQNMRN